MGDTDDRIQEIETRLNELETQQQTVNEVARELVRRVEALDRSVRANPALDETRHTALMGRLDNISGSIQQLTNKLR